MKKSTYMDRALRAKDPRFARILSKLGYERSDMQAGKDEMAELRAEYEKVVGKRPYMGWDKPTLEKKIAEAKEPPAPEPAPAPEAPSDADSKE